MALIRICMDPELLPGFGFGTRKIQSWIRIQNKFFRIHNTGLKYSKMILPTAWCKIGLHETIRSYLDLPQDFANSDLDPTVPVVSGHWWG